MRQYIHKFVPGPTSIPQYLFDHAYCLDLASPDTEAEFFVDYAACCEYLKELLNCRVEKKSQQGQEQKQDVIIMSGEGMAALWGSMKSVLKSGDSVISVCNGIYGDGFADMAEGMGASVSRIKSGGYTKAVNVKEVCAAIVDSEPNLVTMVHCETPSGLLNSGLKEIGRACERAGSLFYVDFVSSAIGCEVDVEGWGIDIGLLGSQKALSLKPDLSIVTVSKQAWKRAEEVAYSGYDALLPFRFAIEKQFMPYTHNWHSILALKLRCEEILRLGVSKMWEKHLECRDICISRGREMGLETYQQDEENASPTVTAFRIPHGVTWKELSAQLKKRGVGVGGSYGQLDGVVFRVGHMGSQADPAKLEKVMDVIEEVVGKLKKQVEEDDREGMETPEVTE
eukprot:Nk52_evm44s96 gene=Nk52_evmTU44s96